MQQTCFCVPPAPGKHRCTFSPMVSSSFWEAGEQTCPFCHRPPKASLTPSGRQVHLFFRGAGAAPILFLDCLVPNQLVLLVLTWSGFQHGAQHHKLALPGRHRRCTLHSEGRRQQQHFLLPVTRNELDTFGGEVHLSFPDACQTRMFMCGVGLSTSSYFLCRLGQEPHLCFSCAGRACKQVSGVGQRGPRTRSMREVCASFGLGGFHNLACLGSSLSTQHFKGLHSWLCAFQYGVLCVHACGAFDLCCVVCCALCALCHVWCVVWWCCGVVMLWCCDVWGMVCGMRCVVCRMW